MLTALALTLAMTWCRRARPARPGPPSPVHPQGHPPPAARSPSFKDKKAVVVVFLGTECPVANLYLPTLAELHKEYADKGVQFLGDQRQRAGHAAARRRPRPGARRAVPGAEGLRRRRSPTRSARSARPRRSCSTPTGVIRYRGRIDDQYGIGYRREKPTRQRPRGRASTRCSPASRSRRRRPRSRAASSAAARRTVEGRRSPTRSTSPRSSRSAARSATGPARSGRCRC